MKLFQLHFVPRRPIRTPFAPVAEVRRSAPISLCGASLFGAAFSTTFSCHKGHAPSRTPGHMRSGRWLPLRSWSCPLSETIKIAFRATQVNTRKFPCPGSGQQDVFRGVRQLREAAFSARKVPPFPIRPGPASLLFHAVLASCCNEALTS